MRRAGIMSENVVRNAFSRLTMTARRRASTASETVTADIATGTARNETVATTTGGIRMVGDAPLLTVEAVGELSALDHV